MTKPMHELLRRQQATNATLARFRERQFDWRAGITCVHLARFHLRQMGHTPPPLPRLRSAIGARRAMRDGGWSNVSDLLDGLKTLQRVPPAYLMDGDLAVVGSEDGLGAILICAGGGKFLGWRDDADGMVLIDVQPHELDGTWRA